MGTKLMINACDLGWMPIKFGGKGAICHCKRGNCKWKKFTASKFGCEPDIEFISDQANGYSIFCHTLVNWGASFQWSFGPHSAWVVLSDLTFFGK